MLVIIITCNFKKNIKYFTMKVPSFTLRVVLDGWLLPAKNEMCFRPVSNLHHLTMCSQIYPQLEKLVKPPDRHLTLFCHCAFLTKGIEVVPTPGHTASCVTVIALGTEKGTIAITGDLFETRQDVFDPHIWEHQAGSENPVQQAQNRQKVRSKTYKVGMN